MEIGEIDEQRLERQRIPDIRIRATGEQQHHAREKGRGYHNVQSMRALADAHAHYHLLPQGSAERIRIRLAFGNDWQSRPAFASSGQPVLSDFRSNCGGKSRGVSVLSIQIPPRFFWGVAASETEFAGTIFYVCTNWVHLYCNETVPL